jgi:pimeloyl-ACP methyl ester carboxylesterase
MNFKGWSVVVVGLVLVTTALGGAAYVQRDIPAPILEAQFARPPSRFITVDGVRLHYRDEGRGPAIVLIHEQFDSLLMWEPWAASLKDRYRVIRFDLTSHGLTGPDRTGDYSLERTLTLLEGLTQRLHLQKFSLAGSSLGGTTALYFAARHPERVDRLILVSPYGVGTRHAPEQASLIDGSPFVAVLAYTAPRFFAAGLLRNGFGDPSRVTDALVDEHSTLLRRAGNRRGELARMRQLDIVDINAHLRALRAPVLVMWGEKSRGSSAYEAEQLRRQLTRAHSVRIDVVRGAGEMAVQEDPEGTARRARDFMDAGHGSAPSEPARPPRDPRFDRISPELPMESVYMTRAA